MSSSQLAISVRVVSKAYTIRHDTPASTLAQALASRLRHPFSRGLSEQLWALRDVSFDVRHGEVIALMGPNGAGKSTLLKIISRITEMTTGEIDLCGRVGSLLEIGAGFHAQLTGRENIFLNGTLLGMTRAEIRACFPAIVDFAGIQRFLDTPVKHYSGGMYVRLAFAVAAHLRSEILILDEVLAAGDLEFQRTCLDKLRDLATDGRAVLLVSHNMETITTSCSRGLLMRGGRLVFDGNIQEAVDAYVSDDRNGVLGRAVGDLDVAAPARPGASASK
jgi:homopolymeric O-antigen transport system ATP-binding protein